MEQKLNILLTGDLSVLAISLAKNLKKNGHDVVLFGSNLDEDHCQREKLRYYPAARRVEQLKLEVYRAHAFDLVIFIGINENYLISPKQTDQTNKIVGSLNQSLQASLTYGVSRFLFISSTDVYGSEDSGREETDPNPDSLYGQILLNGEKFFELFSEKG